MAKAWPIDEAHACLHRIEPETRPNGVEERDRRKNIDDEATGLGLSPQELDCALEHQWRARYRIDDGVLVSARNVSDQPSRDLGVHILERVSSLVHRIERPGINTDGGRVAGGAQPDLVGCSNRSLRLGRDQFGASRTQSDDRQSPHKRQPPIGRTVRLVASQRP